MTNLKRNCITLFWFLAFVGMCIFQSRKPKLKIDLQEKYISLPEEISQAVKGDTLIILYLSEDSLTLGFKN